MKISIKMAFSFIALLIGYGLFSGNSIYSDEHLNSKSGVTFVVNPDDVESPVVPDNSVDDTGNSSSDVSPSSEVEHVVTTNNTMTHNYVEQSTDYVVPDSSETKMTTLPNTGYDLHGEWYLTLLGLLGLALTGFIAYRRL